MRQVVLDTETTGLEWEQGHRVIEIGCVELVNRRKTEETFHCYLQPDREIDAAAEEIHGLSNEMLADKPQFADIAEDFLSFIDGAELVIHNATFDVGFLNHELKLAGGDRASVDGICTVLDTLVLARQLHPGQRNSLDALCKRYDVDNSRRDLHGALVDPEQIEGGRDPLVEVFLDHRNGDAAGLQDAGERRLDDGGALVFETEPLPAGSPLAAAPNMILTPHIAGLTEEANARVSAVTAEKVRQFLRREATCPHRDGASP